MIYDKLDLALCEAKMCAKLRGNPYIVVKRPYGYSVWCGVSFIDLPWHWDFGWEIIWTEVP